MGSRVKQNMSPLSRQCSDSTKNWQSLTRKTMLCFPSIIWRTRLCCPARMAHGNCQSLRFILVLFSNKLPLTNFFLRRSALDYWFLSEVPSRVQLHRESMGLMQVQASRWTHFLIWCPESQFAYNFGDNSSGASAEGLHESTQKRKTAWLCNEKIQRSPYDTWLCYHWVR